MHDGFDVTSGYLLMGFGVFHPVVLMSSQSWDSISDTSGSHHCFYPVPQLGFAHIFMLWVKVCTSAFGTILL